MIDQTNVALATLLGQELVLTAQHEALVTRALGHALNNSFVPAHLLEQVAKLEAQLAGLHTVQRHAIAADATEPERDTADEEQDNGDGA